MAFPVVESVVNSTTGATDSTTLTVTLPTSIASGDLILICFACDGTPTITPPSGYTELLASSFSSRRIVWYKWSSGSEPSSVDVGMSSGEMAVAIAMRISGADANTNPEGNGDIQSTDVPDPPSVTASWGSDDNLWIAGTGGDNRPIVSSWPTNYTANQTSEVVDNVQGSHLHLATRNVAAATEDPGAFTLNFSDQTGQFTIVVRPAQAAGTYTATANALPVGGTTASSSASFAPGTKTATAAMTSGGSTVSASSSFAPGTKTATASPTAGGATGSASASFAPGTKTATAAVTSGAVTGSSAATFTGGAGTFTATASLSTGPTSIRAFGGHGTHPCLTLDGEDDYAEVAHYPEWDLNADFTVFLRVRLFDTFDRQWNGILKKYSGNPWQTITGISLHTHGNTSIPEWLWYSRWYAKIGDGTTAYTKTFANSGLAGDWHTLAVVIDRTADTFAIYLDGSEVETPSDISGLGTIASSQAVQLGTSYHKPAGSWSDVRIYQAALSGSDIATIHNGGVIPTQPLNWWECVDGSGTTLVDKISGKNMTVFGGTEAEYWAATQDVYDPQCIGSAAVSTGGVSGTASASFSTGAGTYTATAAVTTGAATPSSSASFAPGTKTATSTATCGGATSASSVTFAAPIYDATADALPVGGAASASVATYSNTNEATATATPAVGGTILSASATHEPPSVSATAGALEISGASCAADATFATGTLRTAAADSLSAGSVSAETYGCFGTNRSLTLFEDEYADAGDFVNGGTALTVSGWVRPRSLAINTRPLLCQWDYGATQRSWSMSITSVGTLWSVNSTGANDADRKAYQTTTPIPLHEWTHLAMTFAPNDLRCFVNGVEVSVVKNLNGNVSAIFNSSAPVTIGGVLNNGVLEPLSAMDGSLCDLRVYLATLTPQQIADIHANLPIDPIPAAHWDADQTSGGTLIDRVGGNNATIYGGSDLTYWSIPQGFYEYRWACRTQLDCAGVVSSAVASTVAPTFAGAATLAAGSTACASSATSSPPEFTASSGVTLGGATLASSATHVTYHGSMAALTVGGASVVSEANDGVLFPQIASVVTSSTGTVNSTSLTVTLPTGLAVGDLILIVFVCDGTPTVTPPAGYFQLHHSSWNCRRIIWYKWATDSEPASVTVTVSALEMMVAAAMRITKSDTETDPEADGDIESTSAPDPPLVAPTWDAANTLWIAGCGGDGRSLVNSWPANYTDNQTSVFIDSVEGVHLYLASRELNASFEDPGAFNLTLADQISRFTIAVRPFRTVRRAHTVASTAGPATGSATAVFPFYGAAAPRLGGTTFSASGTTTVPVYNATADSLVVGGVEIASQAEIGSASASAAIALNGGQTFYATLTYNHPARFSTAVLWAGSVASSGTASFSVPDYVGTADASVTGVTVEAVAAFAAPQYDAAVAATLGAVSFAADADSLEVTRTAVAVVSSGGTLFASAAIATAPQFVGAAVLHAGGATSTAVALGLDPGWASFASLIVGSVHSTSAASFEPGATAAAALLHGGVTSLATGTFTVYVDASASVAFGGLQVASTVLSSSPGTFTASADLSCRVTTFSVARSRAIYVPWITSKTTRGIADRQTFAVASATKTGRAERPYIPDSGESTIPNRIGGAALLITGAATCSSTASTDRAERTSTAALAAGAAEISTSGSVTPPGRSAASSVTPRGLSGFGSGEFAGPTRSGDATLTVSSAGSTSVAFTQTPIYTADISASVNGASANSSAARVLPVINASATLAMKRRVVGSGQHIRPRYTAFAAMAHSGATGAGTSSSKEESYVALAPLLLSGGASTAATLVYNQPVRTASSTLLHSGAVALASATRTRPVFDAFSPLASAGLTATGSGVFSPPISRTASAALAHSGSYSMTCPARFTPKVFGAAASSAHSGALVASVAGFTPVISGTTPLSQPAWLDGPEDYPYQKLGLAYDAATYETLFTENNVIVVHDNTELSAALVQARTNSNIDAIYLDPVFNPTGYTFPNNSLRYFPGRPLNRPLVIRTLPGSAQQAWVLRVYEDYPVKQVAYVDFKCEAFSIRGGWQDLLVEKCVFPEGNPVIQSAVNKQPITGASTNLQFRLNVSKYMPSGSANLNHTLYTYNSIGFLAEGNILDHGGWTAAQTRASPPPPTGTGPSTRKHNWYCNDYARETYIRFNWISRASSHGLHLKGGGIAYQNLMLRNPINAEEGYGKDGQFSAYGLSSGHFFNNVILDSDHINTSTGDVRGVGLWITCIDGLIVEDNYFLEWTGSPSTNAGVIVLDEEFPILNTIIRNNKAANWANGVIKRGQGIYPHQAVLTNNNWNASFGGSAKTLADILKSESYINQYNVDREGLGVDIYQLKSWMSQIKAGVLG